MATATREEIQAHLTALNAAWQLYDLLENRKIEPKWGKEHTHALNAANEAYVRALTWLSENGIARTELVHDAETLTWGLPDDTVSIASV